MVYVSLFMATYECPSCKLTENPYFIKDNDAMPYHRQEKGIII